MQPQQQLPDDLSLCCDLQDLDINECRNEQEVSKYYKNLKFVEGDNKQPVIDFYRYNTWRREV